MINGLIPGQPTITIAPRKTEQDVARYLDEQIQSQLAGRSPPNHPLPLEIIRTLKKRANGMYVFPRVCSAYTWTVMTDLGDSFRWVELSVEYVCDKSRSEASIREALCKLPPTVIGMYTKMMDELETSEDERKRLLATQVLKWILTARCSFSARHLIEAICPYSPLLDPSRVTKDDVLVACNHLLRWDEIKDKFGSGHISVSTFLQTHNSIEFGHEARHSFLAQMY